MPAHVQLPIWIENGKRFDQPISILKKLGKQHGYYPNGDDLMASYDVEWAVQTFLDFATEENMEELSDSYKHTAESMLQI